MVIIEKSKIKTNKIKFIFNGVVIIAHIVDNHNLCQLVIYLTRENQKYYNVFSKELLLKEENYIINNLWIEHPPFRFYSSSLLSNTNKNKKTLDKFWQTMVSNFYIDKYSSDIVVKKSELVKNDEELPYFHNLVKKNMSERMKDKIIKMYGEDVKEWLDNRGLTCSFTNEEEKGKNLRIVIEEYKK